MRMVATLLRDLWRGYSTAVVRSLRAKLLGPHRAGSVIWLTPREMRAYRATIVLIPWCRQ